MLDCSNASVLWYHDFQIGPVLHELICLPTSHYVHVLDALQQDFLTLFAEAPSLAHRRSNSQGMLGNLLSRSTGQTTINVPNPAPHGDHSMVYTVPADRQAFMRESTTTDCGETIDSSTSGHGVSALSGVSSMGQDAPSAMTALHQEVMLHHPSEAAQSMRGASFDEIARCAPSLQ